MSRSAILSLIFVAGCFGSANDVLTSVVKSDTNYNNLSALRVGMNQLDVWMVMREPEREEKITTPKGNFCVWYYVTRNTVLGQARYVPYNLTPLVFREGCLIGWGWSYYDHAVERNIRFQKKAQLSKPMPLNEDIETEKALEEPFPKETSMSSGVKKTAANNSSANTNPPQEDEEDEEENASKPRLNDEDQEMMEDEEEQDFDFW